jgi:phosphatidylserine decarboxylase
MIVPGLVGGALALLVALPLAWKWELGIPRVGFAVAALAVVSGLIVSGVTTLVPLHGIVIGGLVWLLTLAMATATLAYRFYRDPERTPPNMDGAVVSPADGLVLYLRRATEGVLPVSTKDGRHYSLAELTRTNLATDDAVVIGIAMSFLDVHVNRAPIAGRVTMRRHFPGRFGSLKQPEMVFENERATTIIQQPGLQVAVVQIASRLVRQIAAFVDEGQAVSLGQRIGVIRLGSQVDVVLPVAGVEVMVAPGQRVRAGESVLALRSPETGITAPGDLAV